MENKKEITIRELRRILFEIPDQTLTIKELRRQLFNINNQDEIIRFNNLDFLLREVNKKEI